VGTRYDWLRNPVTMDPQDRRAFAVLRQSELKTARAWALKETAMSLYACVYEGPARKHFRWWHSWAVRSRLGPMIEVAGMLKRRLANIITYLKHPITNATSESINAKIQWAQVHGPRLPQQAQLHQRHLLPLWRPGPRPGSHQIDGSASYINLINALSFGVMLSRVG
jgi:Transposase